MTRPKRTANHVDLREAIKETAWKQIAQTGAPTLSLRSIARELGITAPAIYNYFPRRDDLVTALIIDAYTSFGDWQISANHVNESDNFTGRITAIGNAYRNWALTFPQRYQLIFGTPIPGYEAPLEKVWPYAARSLGALVSVMEDLRLADRLRIVDLPKPAPGYEFAFSEWKNFAVEADILSLSAAVWVWSHVHGLVSLEISNNFPAFGPQGEELYRFELTMIEQFIIKE